MPRRWVYWGLILLVIFLIIQDPSAAGQMAYAFFSWLGSGIVILSDFLESLFNSTGSGTTTTTLPSG